MSLRRIPRMNRPDSSIKAYVLPISKTAFQTVQSINSLIHAPCVAPVIAVALQVIAIIEV